MRKLQCERIKRHTDEHACDWCGGPVYVGERSYHDESSGGLWCSTGCAAADLGDVAEPVGTDGGGDLTGGV